VDIYIPIDVYKHDFFFQIDHKKFEDSDVGYLNLPSTRDELMEGQKPQHGGLILSTKDSFTIHTNVCSTKLTQNGNPSVFIIMVAGVITEFKTILFCILFCRTLLLTVYLLTWKIW
jgi:hypothetical protein